MAFPYDGLDAKALLHAAIEFSGTGDNILVTPPAGQRVVVYQLFALADAATIFRFKSGGTSLTGPLSIPAGGSITLDNNREPWFVTAIGEDFILNQSGTATVGGVVGYVFAR